MAILVEAISVVVRAEAVNARYQGGWDAFRAAVPNQTLCADTELLRVGFMTPSDAESYVKGLEQRGLHCVENGKARDLIVVDQLRGPAFICDWIEFGHINLGGDPKRRVAACRLKGSKLSQISTPEGWRFEKSLSSSYGFVPGAQVQRSLKLLRSEDGLDVFLNVLTGEQVYIGRTAPEAG